MEPNCKNCELILQPEFAHCPGCGQKTHLHRLSLHDVVHEAVHYFFHADKGLFQLIRDLVLQNGRVAKEFVDGRRKKYYPPLTFFFLVIAINLFVSTKTDNHVNVDVQQKYPELTAISNPVDKAKWIRFYSRREHGIHLINTHANTIGMISLPIVALIFCIFYWRRRYNYVEHLVAGMYMFGFTTLVTATISAIAYFLKINENIDYAACLLFQVFYYTVFYRNFMDGKYWRAFFASLTSMLLLFIVSGTLMWFYMIS
ncbi:MAG: DUF3667 domain-containing protein [Flavobacterium sp.]|nr:MAG: DUF3667 domain-containing protein [Flavobacterium sp.]